MSRIRTNWDAVRRRDDQYRWLARKDRACEEAPPSLEERIAAGERRNAAIGFLRWRKRQGAPIGAGSRELA
jgi:hypothetical protein